MKPHEFARIVAKLGLQTRNSDHQHAWFEYGGRIITKTKRSFGAGDLARNLIRQQLKLNDKEFAGMIQCSLGHDDYVAILRKRGLIQDASDEAMPAKA